MTHAKSLGLLIVDLQNDFLSPQGAYARGGAVNPTAAALPERVAAVAKAVKAAGGLVVACQFTLWPNAKGDPMIAPHLLSLRPFLRRGDFQQGTWGHAHVDAIQPYVDVSVSKVAYSAFFNTQLDWVLSHAGIDTLAVCGIVTNGGVASSVRDAHMREYHAMVLSDGCAAFRPEVHQTALADMGTLADVMTCQDFVEKICEGQ
jgi:ureidoacrylate peracid hydrolase